MLRRRIAIDRSCISSQLDLRSLRSTKRDLLSYFD
jgi:hypothetical protein